MEKNQYVGLLKPALVNIVSHLLGDGSVVAGTLKSKNLEGNCYTPRERWNVHVNVAYAVAKFQAVLSRWNDRSPFKGAFNIITDTGKTYHIQQWYAQPTDIAGACVQPINDPHHIYVAVARGV